VIGHSGDDVDDLFQVAEIDQILELPESAGGFGLSGTGDMELDGPGIGLHAR